MVILNKSIPAREEMKKGKTMRSPQKLQSIVLSVISDKSSVSKSLESQK